ncbi:unnamed protein product [Ilex paraguariensis]|uniref:Uncharacterized protein n=1 Tax=Ilex paraguariensis TaxID=185542 RepID=A0ABC8UWA3_9AQUA
MCTLTYGPRGSYVAIQIACENPLEPMIGKGGESEGEKMEEHKESVVLMWGYLHGVSSQRSPILSPVKVRLPETGVSGDSWKDVCGGGCGFAMAISGDSFISAFLPLRYVVCSFYVISSLICPR